MERNMQCGVGHCGHCQLGEKFVCRDGPVFPYSEIRTLFGERGL
jgi:NAD(P)H-flavin reductase